MPAANPISTTMAPAVLPVSDAPLRAIGLIAFGMSIFSLQDVMIRQLGETYPASQIVFVRGLVALVPMAVMVYASGGFATLRVRRPGLNILRGILTLACNVFYYMALVAMPIAEATAIFFLSPLIVTLCSALFMGEPVGARRWAAVAVGFAGILVMLRPGSGLLQPVAILPLVAAVAYAASSLMARSLGKSQTGASLAFSAMLVFVVGSGVCGLLIGDGRFAASDHPSMAFLLRAWTLPDIGDGILLMVCGLIAAVGFFCLAQAYRTAPASTVAPFEYVAMPLAILWGILVWSEIPSAMTLLGIGMVIGSGIYTLRREARRNRLLATGRGVRSRL